MGLGPGPHYGSRLRYFTRVWGVGLEYECMRNVAPLAATAWVFGMMVGLASYWEKS